MENFSQSKGGEKGLNCCGLERLFYAFVSRKRPFSCKDQCCKFVHDTKWKKPAALQRQVDWQTAVVAIFLFCSSRKAAKIILLVA